MRNQVLHFSAVPNIASGIMAFKLAAGYKTQKRAGYAPRCYFEEKEFLLVVARLQGMYDIRPISLPCRAGGICWKITTTSDSAPILF